ncbi:MAG: 50S ribosomal protein L1, partial [Planctomycetes bacterium]|nr:50S ribosomal protein L1 [Planctomycetota bacterium]
LPATKFDQTLEMAIRLGINPKKSDQQIRGSVSLPHGIGKSRKVIVFAAGDQQKEAKEAGADEVGSDDLVKKIQGGWLEFDVAIAAPDMMRHVGKLGKVLGPQGKMPSPKTGTVTKEIAKTVKEYKAGKVEYRSDASGIIHAPVGKLSFDAVKLQENAEAFLQTIQNARPSSAKGNYIKTVSLSATMSPSMSIKN